MRKRGISNIIAILMTIIIVAVAVGVLFFVVSGYLKTGSAKASLVVSAVGKGSPDGRTATLNLVIQNSGDGAARISAIYVEPLGNATSVSGVTAVGASVNTGTGVPGSIGPMPTSGNFFDLDARGSRTIYLKLSGTGLYPGAHLRIYVVYYDVASGNSGVADAIATLQ